MRYADTTDSSKLAAVARGLVAIHPTAHTLLAESNTFGGDER